MNRLFSVLLWLILLCGCSDISTSETSEDKCGICIVGASFAYPENGWFEMACEQMGCVAMNKAVSGSNIIDTAMAMYNSQLFAPGELESFEIFTIMHSHNLDVFRTVMDRNYSVTPNMTAADAFDYVISRYVELCRGLEFDPSSRWYGIAGGKPVDIILCTHWHDARQTYNDSVRKLAQRWQKYTWLCEFDKHIGFSKNAPNPITGVQESLGFAHPDSGCSETINGVEYG